jgi:hypothetical protein
MPKSFDSEKDQILATELGDLMDQINSPETRREIYQRRGPDGKFSIEFKSGARDGTSITAALKFPAVKQHILHFKSRKQSRAD